MQHTFLKEGQNKLKRGLGVLTVVFILNLMFGGREGTIFIDKFNSQLAKFDNTTGLLDFELFKNWFGQGAKQKEEPKRVEPVPPVGGGEVQKD